MDAIDTPAPTALQQEVQRLLGKCLIRAQHCELQLKDLFVNAGLQGTLETLDHHRQLRRELVEGATLGALVRLLTVSHFHEEGAPEPAVPAVQSSSEPQISVAWGITGDAVALDHLRASLGRLIDVRNSVVHQFVQAFDLRTVAGCEAAMSYLSTSFDTIDGTYWLLERWSKNAVDTRRAALAAVIETLEADLRAHERALAARVAQAEAFFRDAAETSLDGWTAIADTAQALETALPSMSPAALECVSWPQFLHQRHRFELRRRPGATAGRRATEYRVRRLEDDAAPR